MWTLHFHFRINHVWNMDSWNKILDEIFLFIYLLPYLDHHEEEPTSWSLWHVRFSISSMLLDRSTSLTCSSVISSPNTAETFSLNQRWISTLEKIQCTKYSQRWKLIIKLTSAPHVSTVRSESNYCRWWISNRFSMINDFRLLSAVSSYMVLLDQFKDTMPSVFCLWTSSTRRFTSSSTSGLSSSGLSPQSASSTGSQPSSPTISESWLSSPDLIDL